MSDITNLIKARRSIRSFTRKPVTLSQLRELVDIARWAPSWANTQSWSVCIINDRDLIVDITNCYSPNNPARTCSANSSAILVVCAEKRTSGYKNGIQRTVFPDWFMFDAGCFTQTLCLQAHQMGLGTVIVGAMDHDRINQLLKCPSGITSVVCIPVGWPEHVPPTSKRKSVDEILSQNICKRFD